MARASAIPAAQLIPAAAVPATRNRRTSRFVKASASRPFAIPHPSGEAGASRNRSARPASRSLVQGPCRRRAFHDGTSAGIRMRKSRRLCGRRLDEGDPRLGRLDRGRALVRVAATGHEGVELLTVLGALQFFDEGRELPGLVVKTAALRLQALQLAPAVVVEGGVAGGPEAEGGSRAAHACKGTREVLLVKGFEIVWHGIPHELPDQINESRRPIDDQGEKNAGHFH